MKKTILNIFGLVLLATLIFVSCKKDETVSNTKNQSEYVVEQLQAQPTKTALTGCAYPLNGKDVWGVMCYVNPYMNQCPKQFGCTPVKIGGDYIDLKKLLELGFTEETLTKWLSGENIIINEKEFFEKYYDFFMILHNEGIIFHPDQIIKDFTNN